MYKQRHNTSWNKEVPNIQKRDITQTNKQSAQIKRKKCIHEEKKCINKEGTKIQTKRQHKYKGKDNKCTTNEKKKEKNVQKKK